MDINSLLSPQDSPRSGPSTPSQSPRKTVRLRSSSLKNTITSSPRTSISSQPSTLPHHGVNSPRKPGPSPPALSPTSATMGGITPSSDVSSSRQNSTPSMDTLADLASMQHRQPASRDRERAPILPRPDSYESQLSPSTMYPNVPPVPLTQQTSRPSFELKMTDVTNETPPPKDFASTALAEADQQQAAQLKASLVDNPYSFENHRKLCKLLHQGFINHVYPPDASREYRGDPHKYDLLEEMRSARDSMKKQYAMGHDLWAEWIQAESLLATTVEERIAVMELCLKATEDEYGCTKLWGTYGEWMLYLYDAASQPLDPDGSQQWSEEDKMVAREIFTFGEVLKAWKNGAEATKWRMHDSHTVWDRYMELLLQDLAQTQSPEAAAVVKLEFERRLQTPHATWDETFQKFSTFISSQSEYNASYEDIMVATKAQAKDARDAWSVREIRETQLKRAGESGNPDVQYAAFLEYLEWSTQPHVKKRALGAILANALYERAILYFPTDFKLWQQYAYYVIDESIQGRPVNFSILALLERATRHCPWSGSLWSQYLLSSESAGWKFDDIEAIKHKATETGILDTGDMEEVLKVLTAWCSYLRRRAFLPESTDEDLDIAEMGIRSSIEGLQKLGEKKFGEEYKGDPYFRLERIYIKYLTESGSWDNARETYKGLVATRGDSHDFWLRYYIFEMIAWGKFIQPETTLDANSAKRTPSPSYATAVLRQALERSTLDWPERIAEVLTSHCEDHEDIEELQMAIIQVNRASKATVKRRETEAAEASFLAQQQQQADQEAAFAEELEDEPVVNGKRKRDAVDDDITPKKRSRPEPEMPNEVKMEDAPQTDTSTVKRDRENASIVVKHLPHDITEIRIRQFFRDCGTINTLKLQTEDGNRTALIEFETKEDAEFAQSRDGRDLDGSTIEVQIGTGSTLYVTNYPPAADETFIRKLFSKYGDIISIRLPSLRYDQHRRFCYVQFSSNASAHAATELDGTTVDGNKLVAKISDPSKRKDRSGAMQEGREVFVGGIHRQTAVEDLKVLFSRFGTIKRVNIPRNVAGKSKGFAFVTFSTSASATAALSLDRTTHIGRTLVVSLASEQGATRSGTTIINRPNETNGYATSRKSSDATSTSDQAAEASLAPDPGGVPKSVPDTQARTLALMNIPDTVNDARVRTLVEPYGQLVKIVLRPDHQGAIIEFVGVSEAGKASLALEGMEIAPGRKIRVGSVPELFKQAPEKKKDKGFQPAAPVRRPGEIRGGLGGRGKRGGLGFSARPQPKESEGGMSNADFKAMIDSK